MASTNEDNRGNDDLVDRPLRVCFVVLDAYPAIEPRVSGGIGGIETRSWMFAKSLSERAEFDVSFMVRTPRRVMQSEYSGVKLLPIYDRFSQIRTEVSRSVKRKAGFPWLSFSEFRWKLFWQLPLLAFGECLRPVTHTRDLKPLKTYSQFFADIFVCFGVNAVSASVIATAKSQRKKSVLFISSDIDLDERYTPNSNYVNIYHSAGKACHFAVANADKVIVQTPEQLRLLKQNFQREGELISNPIDLEEWDEQLQSAESPAEIGELKHYVLWVGRAERNQKQPQLVPELARLCPELSFLMIMNPSDEELERQVRADAPQNLHIVEKIPFAQMPSVYQNASVFVNTSSSEGFPNTFLQAAASGVPIASLNVGEEFLREANAGETARGSLETLAKLVSQMFSNSVPREVSATKQYLNEHHELTMQIDRLEEMLKRTARSSSE